MSGTDSKAGGPDYLLQFLQAKSIAEKIYWLQLRSSLRFRRSMHRRLFLETAEAPQLWMYPAGGSRAASAARRPNLLIIMTDQQFYAMSCRIGDRYIRTPNMHSLAAKRTTFTRAYCANPLCVCRYVHRAVPGRDRRAERHKSRRAAVPTHGNAVPARNATGYFGKWHMPYREATAAVHGFYAHEAPEKAKGDIGTAVRSPPISSEPSAMRRS